MYGLDLFGHGLNVSSGDEMRLPDWHDLVNTQVGFIGHILTSREYPPTLPIFLCGEALGAALAFHVALGDSLKDATPQERAASLMLRERGGIAACVFLAPAFKLTKIPGKISRGVLKFCVYV